MRMVHAQCSHSFWGSLHLLQMNATPGAGTEDPVLLQTPMYTTIYLSQAHTIYYVACLRMWVPTSAFVPMHRGHKPPAPEVWPSVMQLVCKGRWNAKWDDGYDQWKEAWPALQVDACTLKWVASGSLDSNRSQCPQGR